MANTDLKFSSVLPRDLGQIHDLERLLFPDPWPMESLIICTRSPVYRFIVGADVSDPTRILCYAIIEPGLLGRAELSKIGVDQSVQGTGIGKQLMSRVVTVCKYMRCDTLSLRVRQNNTVAKGFYESFGFIQCSTIPDYYLSPVQDAHVMLKKLD